MNPKREPSIEPSKADSIDAEVQKVWEKYVEIFDPPRAKLGPNRVRGIKRALQEVDAAVLCDAVVGLFNYRRTKAGDTSLETIWKTYKGTGSMVERIEFFASKAGSSNRSRTFPSADPAIVAEKQRLVQRGHRFQDQAETVKQAKDAELWLRERGIETVRREEDGYPIFRPLRKEPSAS